MKYDFILASQNNHKVKEFDELLADESGVSLSAPQKSIPVDETGETYAENAFLKAKAYYEINKVPAMADDSGLEIESLPGELGVYSARFGGGTLSYEEQCELVLEKLKNYPEKEQRKAYFVCYLCFYLNPQEVYFFEGRLNGHIGHQRSGDQGFGYDPIFIPEGADPSESKSLAEVSEWKKSHSHRAKAISLAENFFKTLGSDEV